MTLRRDQRLTLRRDAPGYPLDRGTNGNHPYLFVHRVTREGGRNALGAGRAEWIETRGHNSNARAEWMYDAENTGRSENREGGMD